MPRYFLHLVRGEARIPDPDGINISENDMASLRGAKIYPRCWRPLQNYSRDGKTGA